MVQQPHARSCALPLLVRAGKAGSWYLDFSGFTVSFQVDSKTSTSKPLFPGVLTGTGRISYAGFFDEMY